MSQQQPTTEERLAHLESRVNELEQARRDQDTINGALLARIDSFIGDIHRLERDQRRGFDAVLTHQREQDGQIAELTKGMAMLVEIARDHRQAIEAVAQQGSELAAGQSQILEILQGKPKTND